MKKLLCILFLLFFYIDAYAQYFTVNDKNIKVSPSTASQGSNIVYQRDQAIAKTNAPINKQPQIIQQPLSPDQVLLNQKILEKPQIKTDCDRDKNVCLVSNVFKNRIIIELENRTNATRTAKITAYFQNVKSLTNVGNNFNIILEAKQRKQIDTIIQLDPTQTYGYKYDYTSYMGKKDAVHDDSYVYDLPFDYGKSYRLLQTYGGSFSHNSPDAFYSYDFRMTTGESVLAARDGKVVLVKEHFYQGGTFPSLKSRANRIFIEHSDGTIAIYAHLAKNGAIVKEGDYVQKGQPIGYSGNTGFSDVPHLHFNVSKVIDGGKFRSVPFKIRTSTGIQKKLQVGTYYEK